MTDTHVISALRLKRAEISGHIHDLEKRIARQRDEIVASRALTVLRRLRKRGAVVSTAQAATPNGVVHRFANVSVF